MPKWRWIVLFAVVTIPACGPSRKSVYPVKGRITDVDGKPIAGAVVYFIRVGADPNDKDSPVSSSGTSDASGEYTLTTYETGDGAPEGEYVVIVSWPGEKKVPGPGPGPDRLNGQYSNEKTSQIHRKVEKSGANEMETIKVSTTAPPAPAATPGSKFGKHQRGGD
jgi:hypothetical protein